MLLIWEYFWNESDWTGSASATATASVSFSVVTTFSAGGGGPMIVVDTPVEPALELESFWEVREAYLRRVHSEAEQEVSRETIEDTLLAYDPQNEKTVAFAQAVADRERAYRKAQEAKTIAELQDQATLIANLTIKLADLRAQMDDEIIFVFLLTE